MVSAVDQCPSDKEVQSALPRRPVHQRPSGVGQLHPGAFVSRGWKPQLNPGDQYPGTSGIVIAVDDRTAGWTRSGDTLFVTHVLGSDVKGNPRLYRVHTVASCSPQNAHRSHWNSPME